MAITAYTGPPGSGKSYALVHDVILPALAQGRRVLSNIDGLNPDLIADFLEAKEPDRDFVAKPLGSLDQFQGAEAIEPGFWPDMDAPGVPAKVQGGDLVVFDEVGIHWPIAGKFPPSITKYLRFHRHFVDTAGQSTDIVLATQGVTDIHRHYRSLVERTFKFKKLSTIGLSKSYAWSVWEGSSQRKGEAVINGQGRYKAEIFPLYKSYKGPGGAESSTDRRANVWKQPKLWAVIGGTALSAVAALWFLWSVFAKHETHAEPKGVSAQSSGPSAGAATSQAVTTTPSPAVSSTWRVAGMLDTPAMRVVVLADRQGALRYEDLSNCYMVGGRPYVCTIDGQRAFSIGAQGMTSAASSAWTPLR